MFILKQILSGYSKPKFHRNVKDWAFLILTLVRASLSWLTAGDCYLSFAFFAALGSGIQAALFSPMLGIQLSFPGAVFISCNPVRMMAALWILWLGLLPEDTVVSWHESVVRWKRTCQRGDQPVHLPWVHFLLCSQGPSKSARSSEAWTLCLLSGSSHTHLIVLPIIPSPA